MNKGAKKDRGFTIVELIVVMGILSVVMAAIYTAYSVQLRQGMVEYRLSASEMELQIARSVMEHDIAMAGYGLDKQDPPSTTPPVTVAPVSNTPAAGGDTLTMNGTALGRASRATQAWTFTLTGTNLNQLSGYYSNTDPLQTLKSSPSSDRIIFINPITQALLEASTTNGDTGTTWLFKYLPSTGSSPNVPDAIPALVSVLAYGLTTSATLSAPYNAVTYSLGGTPPSTCAPGTFNLQRSENGSAQPLLDCVLDFKVAFGIFTGSLTQGIPQVISCWDDGTNLATYSITDQRKRLKQVRLFALVQEGQKDSTYSYVNPGTGTQTVRVGDLLLTKCGGGGFGEDVVIQSNQSNYRWRVLNVAVTPRNTQ